MSLPTTGGADAPMGEGGGNGKQPQPIQATAAQGAIMVEEEVKGGSPQKRVKHGDQTLTLDMLREVLAQERNIDRQHLTQSLQMVQGDMQQLRGRMDAVEGGVTQQMQNTLAMLTKITNNYDDQAKTLKDLKDGQKGMEERILELEKKPPGGSAPQSTADTMAAGESNRKPAIIMGGWHPDQAAEETLKAAKEILQRLEVPLDTQEMFVPGVRRGYAIVPIPPRPFEAEECRRARVQAALQRVRNANMSLGQNEQGGLRKLWIAISQSPERRRRAKLAGKVKRTILEMQGDSKALDVEFATRTVWMHGYKVCSATAEKPKDAETAGAGWIDIVVLAKAMKKAKAEVETAWGPRKAELA